ncbi:hypothetical protein D3C80_1427660 [compost metagenome]
MISGQVIAESADKVAVCILERIIIRHDIVQEFLLGHMGIYDIQNDAHSGFMNRVNETFQFLDPLFRICRIL